jgi:ribosomal protein S18 acetylase RimI-like enzyme
MPRFDGIDYNGEEDITNVLDAHRWVCIRKMALNDIEQVNRIDAKSMESRISMDWFSKILLDSPDLQFVAVDARTNPSDPSNIIGFVVGRPYDPATKSPTGYISRIAVLPQFRNRGVGTMLAHAFEYGLILRGVSSILVHARTTNSVATRFYHGLGFTDREIVTGHYKKPPGDGIVMTKNVVRGYQNFNSCFPL